MSKFNPRPKQLVVNELIEKGYTVDYDDALRLCHELEEEEKTDGKIAIALAAVGIIGAGVTLAFCGAVAPLLVPIAAIGVGMSGVWNHPIRATRRDDEADFLRANPSIVPIIESKLQSDEAPFKITSAYAECFRSWQLTGKPLALPTVENSRLILPSHPTDEELQVVGNRLCDRLKVAGKFADLERIGQRVKAGDLKGGLKMAISANGLNAASFLDAFPGKAHLYDWSSEAMAAVIPTAEKEQTIADYIETTKPSDRDIESAVKQAQSVTTPTKADVLKMPLSDRADYLLKLLAEYGCDLRNLIGRPTLAAGGLQRSGKTTLLLLTGILEKAKGNKLFYITRDNDLYPISFDGYASGSTEEAVKALLALSTMINTGSMGSLSGETWVLDEFSAISGELPKPKQAEFWGMALTGFAKQGGRVRFAVHHKTATANGLPPGQAETFKAEIKMLWTDRTELQDGTYQPSGQYELLQEVAGYYKASGQTFQIPLWLLTEKNPAWHNAPCPVRSLLTFFPEFDTRKGAIAHSLNESKPKDPFNRTVQVANPSSQSQPVPTDDPWQEYEIYAKEMNKPVEWNRQTLTNIGRLVGALQTSPDPRSPEFIQFLSDLQPGKDVSSADVDPTFLQIAKTRKILDENGVVI